MNIIHECRKPMEMIIRISMKFKVSDSSEEKEASDTVNAALKQIEEKRYKTVLIHRNF